MNANQMFPALGLALIEKGIGKVLTFEMWQSLVEEGKIRNKGAVAE